MSDQPGDSANDSEPPPTPPQKFVWVPPVILHGPLGRDYDSSDGGPIREGGFRDSLELEKYQPPNPLGVRRLSRASAAAGVDPEMPGLIPEVEANSTFSLPSTMSRGRGAGAGSVGGCSQRREGPSHALNVIQPYPTLTGRKRKRAPSAPNLGPLPERLLKRVPRELSLSSPPDGILMANCKPLDEVAKGEEASAVVVNAAPAPNDVWARRVETIIAWVLHFRYVGKGKGKANGEDKAVPAAQKAGDETLQAVTAETEAEGKEDWQMIELFEVATTHGEARDGK